MRISFKHMESTEALRSYIEEKISKVTDKFFVTPTNLHITVEVTHGLHVAHLNISGGQEFNFNLTSRSTNMYAAIDQLHDILEKKLSRLKDRATHHSRQSIKGDFLIAEDD